MLTKILTTLKCVAIALGFYCFVALALTLWPFSGIMAAAGTAYYFRRRRNTRLEQLGSARFAERQEIEDAGMFDAKTGIILGRVEGDSRIVRLPKAVHTCVYAPTGAGKGVSLVIPNLYKINEAAVVVDFKGELAKITASYREKVFGHRIVLIDPDHVVTEKPDRFNPMDPILASDRQAIDACTELANEIVVRTGTEHDPHFNDAAEMFIAGVAATIVGYGADETRSLRTIREILSDPAKLEKNTRIMLQSPLWNGALQAMGGQFLHFVDRERASVLTSAARHLRFLASPNISDSVSSSTFDPRDLRKTGKMTVYLILPPQRAIAQAGLLRLWVGSLLRASVQGGLA